MLIVWTKIIPAPRRYGLFGHRGNPRRLIAELDWTVIYSVNFLIFTPSHLFIYFWFRILPPFIFSTPWNIYLVNCQRFSLGGGEVETFKPFSFGYFCSGYIYQYSPYLLNTFFCFWMTAKFYFSKKGLYHCLHFLHVSNISVKSFCLGRYMQGHTFCSFPICFRNVILKFATRFRIVLKNLTQLDIYYIPQPEIFLFCTKEFCSLP